MATQSTRDKMRQDERQQFNIWLPKETATHLKALRERTGKPYPALIADALTALENALSGEPAEPSPAPVAADNELLNRLAALECDTGPRLASAFHGIGELRALTDSCTRLLEELQDRVIRLECNPALTAHRPISGVVSEKPLLTPSPEPEAAEIPVSVTVAAVPGAQSTGVSDTGLTPSSSSATKALEPESAESETADRKYQRFSSEQLGLRERRVIEMWQSEKNKSEIGRLLAKEGLGAKGGYEPLHAKEVSKILEKNDLK